MKRAITPRQPIASKHYLFDLNAVTPTQAAKILYYYNEEVPSTRHLESYLRSDAASWSPAEKGLVTLLTTLAVRAELNIEGLDTSRADESALHDWRETLDQQAETVRRGLNRAVFKELSAQIQAGQSR